PRGCFVGMRIATWGRVNARKPRSCNSRLPAGKGYGVASAMGLSCNWLRVLGTAESSQVDQRVCQQLHAIVSLLDAFKAEQQPLEFVLPGKGALDAHA